MRRFFCVLAMACVCAAIMIGAALAGGGSSGKGPQTLSASCTVLGSVTVHASSGASAWVNNTHYVLLKLTGTFTPSGGTAQPFTKVYGHKHGFSTTYVCTGSNTTSAGTLSFTAWVVRTGAR